MVRAKSINYNYKICHSCRHLNISRDREMCFDWHFCDKYGGLIGKNKHICKKLKKDLIRQIKVLRENRG